MHDRKAFSLIELLVVIAIIGVLAAIAVPSYNAYQIRAKVAKVIIVLDAIAKNAQIYYSRNGVYPASLTVNGITVPNPSWTAVAYGDITNIGYQGDNKGILLHAVINGIGTNNLLSYVVRDQGGGVTKTACGQYSSASTDGLIPFNYLPASCRCADIAIFYANGTGC